MSVISAVKWFVVLGKDFVGVESSGTKVEGSGGLRGCIGRFTSGSRKRLFQLVTSIPKSWGLPTLLTLTLPAAYSMDPVIWQRHFKEMQRRLKRRYPLARWIWRREFQDRGAPHWHLAVWGLVWLDREWLSETWCEICGGDIDHLAAGTRIEVARNRRAALVYLSKELAKTVQAGCEQMFQRYGSIGRSWGSVGIGDGLEVRKRFRVTMEKALELKREITKRAVERSQVALRFLVHWTVAEVPELVTMFGLEVWDGSNGCRE